MKKRKPLEKEDARLRRDRLMNTAAQGQLSLTEGVREMRAISGLTQEQFAQHRGIGTRVVKALELGQGNPTVATLNRIAGFYGLEVAFVPSKLLKVNAQSAVPAQSPAIESSGHAQAVATAKGTSVEHMVLKEWMNSLDFDRLAKNIAERLGAELKAQSLADTAVKGVPEEITAKAAVLRLPGK
jgi:transcriptional regulator with XRE-family HTH domain